MKRLESKIGILQHKVKNTNQLKIKNQNLRLEKMRLLKAVERRDKKIKELKERINKTLEFIDHRQEDINNGGNEHEYRSNEFIVKILKGEE